MVSKTLCLVLTVFCAHHALGRGNQDDILEWLDYVVDEIPDDAIPIGHTLNNSNIYVGLVHVIDGDKEGFVPTDIIEGEKCVWALIDLNPVQVCDNIKILSGKNDYLNKVYWNEARPSFFMSLFDSDDFRPVRVGWEVGDDDGIRFNSSLYLSRSFFSGRNFVSKIYTSRPDSSKNSIGYFVFRDYSEIVNVIGSAYYEVFMFRY